MEKKVLHILSGDLWGGAEAQVLMQSSALAKLGWNIQVLLFNKGETSKRLESCGITCHICPEERGLASLLCASSRLIGELDPEILVAHGYKESIVAQLGRMIHRIPWVSTFHGLTENYRGWAGLKMRLYTTFHRFLSRVGARRLITVSCDLAQKLGFSELDKLKVVYNVSNSLDKASSASTITAASHLDLNHPAIVCVGRLVRVKRLDVALSAFKELIMALEEDSKISPHLYVIGDGPERRELEELMHRLGCANLVHFMGFRENARDYIEQADVFLLSSDSEGIPTVILEAIASQIPIVATEVGGIPEVFRHIPKYPVRLVARGDTKAASVAIVDLLDLTREDLDRNNIANAFERNFSVEVAAKTLDSLFLDILTS